MSIRRFSIRTTYRCRTNVMRLRPARVSCCRRSKGCVSSRSSPLFFETGKPIHGDVLAESLRLDEPQSGGFSLPLQLPVRDRVTSRLATENHLLQLLAPVSKADRMMKRDEDFSPSDARGFAKHGLPGCWVANMMQETPDNHAVNRLVPKRQEFDVRVSESHGRSFSRRFFCFLDHGPRKVGPCVAKSLRRQQGNKPPGPARHIQH